MESIFLSGYLVINMVISFTKKFPKQIIHFTLPCLNQAPINEVNLPSVVSK